MYGNIQESGLIKIIPYSSVSQFSHSVVSDSLQPHGLQHVSLPCPSPIPRACSNLCPLRQQCHPTISSVVPFSSCPQSFSASGSFPVSQLFTSRGQRIGVSASASVLPMNIQDWFSLGWTDWISLQSKGHSRVFSKLLPLEVSKQSPRDHLRRMLWRILLWKILLRDFVGPFYSICRITKNDHTCSVSDTAGWMYLLGSSYTNWHHRHLV